MINSIKEKYRGLNSTQKRAAMLSLVGAALLGAASIAYHSSHNTQVEAAKAEQPKDNGAVVDIGLNSNHLQQSAYLQNREEMSALKKELEDLKNGKAPAASGAKPGSAAAGQPAQGPQAAPSSASDLTSLPGLPSLATPAPAPAQPHTAQLPKVSEPKHASKRPQSLPPVPAPMPLASSDTNRQLPPPPPGMMGNDSKAGTALVEERTVGAIAFISNPTKADKSDKSEDQDKKKADRIYLPPSFMTATMLSGLDAPTSSGGSGSGSKGGPVPVLLRVKDLSILPNKLKANLKGCFVIAEGVGNLSSERAELRLVSLTCLDKKSQAVIDQDITGFVVDTDGKIGLRGRVVATKLGATIARSMMAGFFGGVGSALNASVTQTSILPTGSVSGLQSIDPKTLAYSGIGQGLSNAASEMQKFYMELARQSMPVIEVGATREITVVIQKGVELSIKDMSGGKK